MTCGIILVGQISRVPDTHKLEEERFILARGFRGFSPWLAGFQGRNILVERASQENCLRHGTQEAESWERAPEERAKDQIWCPQSCSHDSFPSTRPHHLISHSPGLN